ncbi:MAG: hypothetical protein A2126_01995 [Candidatus Woykebacteria bacterium GWB1_45_5]|uniref:POTRA domain-containing protein n=2 Tax=Candidatus Woykeibacteriota TaxID=1817899 RepID=A0A1G1W1U6_9BACT|nr:MAG: hypothetical protein A2113_03745 [Candidatus Woykebacteria bacterium GWA1_44_8]OGY23065.1 MAG: hypothetical protein A2126_01995 [Candidatus Woykebacteria bacterium GWB1_45_5]
MSDETRAAKVFSTPKIHSRTKVTRLAIEVILLLIVLIGTGLTLFWPTGFSLEKNLQNLKEILSLKRQKVEVKGLSFEEKVRGLVDGKVIHIALLEKSSEGFVTVRDDEGLAVIFSPKKDLETQVRTLQTLLSKAKIEKRAITLVDFRFDKLVVRYK